MTSPRAQAVANPVDLLTAKHKYGHGADSRGSLESE